MASLPVSMNNPILVRLTATPPLAGISSSSLSLLLIKGAQAVQTNLPLANTESGSLFQDRFDANLRWYIPGYVLAADPDDSFSFAASQSGIPDQQTGHPFNTGRLTLRLTKVIPDDVSGFKAANTAMQIQEIPLADLNATLTTTSKDGVTGQDKETSYSGVVTVAENGNLQLTFDNIIGVGVIILYENLIGQGSATVSISGSYEVWRRIGTLQPIFVRPLVGGGLFRAAAASAASTTPPSARAILTSTVVPGVFQPSVVVQPPVVTRPLPFVVVPTIGFPVVTPPAPDDNQFQQGTSSEAFNLPLGTKYAANAYALRYTVSDATTTRPIINVNDLSDYNVRQSEFTELTALGDISQRYPSLSRAYLGVLSRTIVVIPSSYAIARNSSGLGAVCEALLDSASSAVSQCKFQFTFLLAPDISPVDLIEFQQEVSNNQDLKNYTVKLPEFLKEGTSPKLLTAFQSSCQYAVASDPHTFALEVEIRDQGTESPAVASANLLIKQLCSPNQPFLFATLSLKLDDYYAEPVEANAVLNVRQTSGTDELTYTVDENSGTVTLSNRSLFDLLLSRYAFCTPNSVSISSTNQTVKSLGTASLPLPADHTALSVFIDSELAVQGPIAGSEVSRFVRFDIQNVQSTQYAFGINASGVNFDGRGISAIDVDVSLTDVPSIAVPRFSLLKLRSVDGTTVIVPLQNAITSLQAIVLFTVHHTDPQQSDTKFTMQHDFRDEPILTLGDPDLSAALPS